MQSDAILPQWPTEHTHTRESSHLAGHCLMPLPFTFPVPNAPLAANGPQRKARLDACLAGTEQDGEGSTRLQTGPRQPQLPPGPWWEDLGIRGLWGQGRAHLPGRWSAPSRWFWSALEQPWFSWDRTFRPQCWPVTENQRSSRLHGQGCTRQWWSGLPLHCECGSFHTVIKIHKHI